MGRCVKGTVLKHGQEEEPLRKSRGGGGGREIVRRVTQNGSSRAQVRVATASNQVSTQAFPYFPPAPKHST